MSLKRVLLLWVRRTNLMNITMNTNIVIAMVTIALALKTTMKNIRKSPLPKRLRKLLNTVS